MNDITLPAELAGKSFHGLGLLTWLFIIHSTGQLLGRLVTGLREGGGLRSIIRSIYFGSATAGPKTPGGGPPAGPGVAVVLALLILPSCLLLSACKGPQLEAGGAYAPLDANGVATVAADPVFFEVDSAYDLAYSTLDGAFLFERQNRQALWAISPQIKHTLDSIRPQAWGVAVQYARARQAYITNPIPANLSTLQSVLAHIQQLLASAQAVLPSSKPTAPVPITVPAPGSALHL